MEHNKISQILKSLGSVKSQNLHTSAWIYSTAAKTTVGGEAAAVAVAVAVAVVVVVVVVVVV